MSTDKSKTTRIQFRVTDETSGATLHFEAVESGGFITIKPTIYPDVTLDKLKDPKPPTLFHEDCCRLVIGPRGSIEYDHTFWRKNGRLQTWKTRPTEFRLPLKFGLRGFGELTHHTNMLHASGDCPLLLAFEGKPIAEIRKLAAFEEDGEETQ